MYVVTRQAYWPDGNLVVEIAEGGIDYCNPDALVQKYEGEFEEFYDPREAATCALKILKLWEKDNPKARIGIAHGNTGGMTMPFEPVSKDELYEWALQEYENLPECDGCGEVIGNDAHGLNDYPEFKFCSDSCAQRMFDQICKEG